MTSDPIRRLEVDGEVFEVTTRPDLPGQVDLSGITGPDAGYGFSSRRSSGVNIDDELRHHIGGFLANINPETGHLHQTRIFASWSVPAGVRTSHS